MEMILRGWCKYGVTEIKMDSENFSKSLLSVGGRYWVRTSDLFRVKEALLPLS